MFDVLVRPAIEILFPPPASATGSGKTIKAMAAYLARLIYRMLTRGEEWVDRGAAEFEKRRKYRQEQSLRRMAKDLGYTLTPAA